MNKNIEYLWHDRKRTFLGLPWSFTQYAVNEDRIFLEKGFFNKEENEVRLYRVMDVSLHRSFGQRILGIGTIKCCSGDKTMGTFEIKNIKDPQNVKEMLSELVEKEREAKRVLTREYMGGDDDHDEDHDDVINGGDDDQ